MNRRRKVWFWIIAGFSLCGFAFLSTCVVQTMFESWRAYRFLRIASAMRPGSTSEVDALKALRTFGSGTGSTVAGEPLLSRVWDEHSHSFLEANGRGYTFDNWGLRFLHLAGKKMILGTLFFRQGKLVSTWVLQVELAKNAECYVIVQDAARDFADLPDPQNGKAVKLDERGSPVASVHVNVFPSSTQLDRSKAYSLNPGRLSSPFSCHDAQNLIPQLAR